MSTLSEWGPTGVGSVWAHLSDDTWEQIVQVTKGKTGRNPPDGFRSDLDGVLTVYVSMKRLKDETKPSVVKKQLSSLQESADALVDAIRHLNQKSFELLGRAASQESCDLLPALQRISGAARSTSKSISVYSDRNAALNWPARSMGASLVYAIATHIGRDQITTTENGLFYQLFVIVTEEAGTPLLDPKKWVRRAVAEFKETTAVGNH